MSRIAFISPCGFGNLGDAAIIDSLIAGIRCRLPGAEIVGFTLNPSDTVTRHRVEAGTCGGFSLPHYPMRPISRQTENPAGALREQMDRPPPKRFARRVIANLPGARTAWHTATRMRADRKFGREIAERIAGFDHVVVAGGGQLDDLWGGAFGHPYTLLRWSRAAQRAGAQFSILSVGTGSLTTATSHAFVTRALNNASYRSFRDTRSRELAHASPAESIVPDLAYALPIDPVITAPRRRPAIGVAPMCYADPRVWPNPSPMRYADHIASMAQIAANAAKAGNDVIVFSTDRPDRSPAEECYAQAITTLDEDVRSRVRICAPDQTSELIDVLASLDVVVAARFHGVLLSHVVGIPAFGVAHERKVTTLMAELGQESYCAPIDGLDPTVVDLRIKELLGNRESIRTHIASTAAGYRNRVEEQYDRVFGHVVVRHTSPEVSIAS